MDFERIIHKSVNLCEYFIDKSIEQTLNEFEILAYEQICNMIASYAKMQTHMLDKAALELEKELVLEKQKHEKWISDNDDEARGSQTPAT